MAEEDVPNADGGPDEQRGAVCRAALLKTLSTLESKNFDVGLVLFGHRFHWKNVGTRQAEKWVAAATKLGESSSIPATEWDPDQDVEVAVPLAPFGSKEMDEFRPLLGRIEHKYGTVSPLYRAMETALREFEKAEDKQAPRFLIVLTDGVNQLFKEEARLRDRQFTDVMAVRKALDKTGTMFSKVKCVLVYLQPKEFDKDGENDDQTAFKSLEAEFKELEKDGRGGLFTAKDPSGVSSMLLDSLDWIEFSIPESNAGRMNLGATIENLPLSPEGNATKFELEVESRSGSFSREATLLVEGGEHFEYTFRHKDGSLIIPEYPESRGVQPQHVRILPKFNVKALLPQVKPIGRNGEVTLPISVQAVADQEDRSMLFTPRPAAIHAEVRGLSGDAELPPIDKLNDNSHCLTSLCLYERVFQNGTPVPVIPLQFPKWTRDPIRASVDLWFRMSPVPESEFDVDISLADALDSKFAVPTIWQEGAGLLSVKELYSEMGTEILVRVEQIDQSQYLETRVELSKSADRIERNFFIEPVNAVVHRFQFARNNPLDKADVRLRILTAKKFKAMEGTIHATDQAAGGPFLIDTSSVE